MWRQLFSIIPAPMRRAVYRVLAPVRMAIWRATHHPRYYETADRRAFFRKALYTLNFNGIDGDYCEFGCHSGLTFTLAYHESRRIGYHPRQWAFDSFAGMPEHESDADAHPSWEPGSRVTTVSKFKEVCARNGVSPSDYEIVQGYYCDTLVTSNAQRRLPDNISLAYIDCDLYSSASEVLGFLSSRLKNGMIIAFDDYFCWSASQTSGERRAFLEFAERHPEWNFVPYLRYAWSGQSFIVERSSGVATQAPT